ncbi:ATP-binding protein [Magnetospirillum sp. UT-4]|uniref:ATP-binding protein n=1 Tax=Magnetospirillum sp. UT-4 TaxID=2681467 RepID=UPI0013852E49|nr:ATP-binding protein [Magnetospirillum sp. UT-4]CAA7615212.1 conserved hypothetical protein [Magnetospirillum sp. UT-4]
MPEPAILLLADGVRVAPKPVHDLDAAGAQVVPFVEGMGLDSAHRILLAAGDFSRIQLGLHPPLSGFVQGDGPRPLELGRRCLDAVRGGGFCLSLIAATAYECDVAALCIRSIAQRFAPPEAVRDSIELALGEAVGNAVIHGSLGISSDMRASLAEYQHFHSLLEDRLRDPHFAGRRVDVAASGGGGHLTVSVSDQGEGFDIDSRLARSADREAKSGRGLGLIRQLAADVAGEDGGRTLVMRFAW